MCNRGLGGGAESRMLAVRSHLGAKILSLLCKTVPLNTVTLDSTAMPCVVKQDTMQVATDNALKVYRTPYSIQDVQTNEQT